MENARAEIIRKISKKIQDNQYALRTIEEELRIIQIAIDNKDVDYYFKMHLSQGISTIMTTEPTNEGMAYVFLGFIAQQLIFEKNRRQELINMYTSTDYVITELEVLSQDIQPIKYEDGIKVPQGEQDVQVSD